jgi:hypothetical protein
MLWGKKSGKEDEKRFSGPREIPGLVQGYLVSQIKMDADLVKLLKAVLSRGSNGNKATHIRVFDESEAHAKKVDVRDYTTLDEHPDITLFEGSFEEAAKQVTLEEKKKGNFDTPILSEAEIREKIEGLDQPGGTAFFYLGRGCSHGGPLGMGAAIVELNPNYPGKKQKKYNIYVADVIDTQPGEKGERLFDSDKPKNVASWVKSNHHKRVY